MAGDWIKMRVDLNTSPKVVRISSALRADRLRVVGGLHAVWCLFDVHSEDGKLNGYTLEALDELIGFTGFAGAMVSVGWLQDGGDFLCTPRFEEHNGQSAKRRAMEMERKRESRKTSAPNADKKRTREEKRKEDINTTPIPPIGGKSESKKKQAVSLQTFLDNCKTVSEKPIPENDPVFDYAESVGLTLEILRIHWQEFKSRYTLPDAKRYKDWRAVYRKSVRGNWFKIWYIGPDGQVGLTTVGIQAQRASA